MKRVTIELNGIKYTKVGGELKYELLEDYWIDCDIMVRKPITMGFVTLKTTGRLHIYAGYRWNGATGVPDTDSVIRASLVHDALFDLFQVGLLGTYYVTKANTLFKNICKEDGMLVPTYWLYRSGLFLFSRLLIPRRFRKRMVLEKKT